MSRLPPPPGRDLARWAEQLYDYLAAQPSIQRANEPTPLLLPHMTSGVMARATTDGLLLFDPVTGKMQISIGGAWVAIADATEVGGGGGPTNLSYTAATRLLESSTGADVTLPLATGTDAGLMSSADFTRLAALGTAATATVYVSKIGNDANSGLTTFLSKLTLGSAITAASSLITAGANAVLINVMDGGSYTGTIAVPTNVHVIAPAATFVGVMTVAANASFVIDKHFASANNDNMAGHAGGGAGAAIYIANISDGRGTGGALTGVNNVRNIGGGGRNLFTRVGILYVTTNGTGIGDVSTGDAGHIHFLCPDIYLAGNSAVGILGSAVGAGVSNIVGYTDHILEVGTPTTTVGIRLNNASAAVKITASEIIADTAYDIVSGLLYIACPKITGVRTGTPTNRMIGTEDIGVAVQAYSAVLAATTASFTTADETKLDGIESGAQVNVATDLSYTAATRLLISSTGADVTLPLVVAGGTAGLMTGTDKTKLDSVETNAQVNVGTDLTYGALLRELGSSTGSGVTLPLAGVLAGLMSAADKTKLDGIASGAQVNVATDLSYTAATRLLISSTGADVTLPLFTSTDAGLTPLSGGGTTNFLRADGTWAAPGGGGGGAWTTVFQAADQLVTNSATLADATNLQFTTVANTNYRIRVRILLNSGNATADIKYRLTHAGTTTRVRRARTYSVPNGTSATIPTIAPSTAFDSADQTLLATVTGDSIVYEDIYLQVGAAGGIFKFAFAQNTLTAAVSVTLYEGSYIEYATT